MVDSVPSSLIRFQLHKYCVSLVPPSMRVVLGPLLQKLRYFNVLLTYRLFFNYSFIVTANEFIEFRNKTVNTTV